MSAPLPDLQDLCDRLKLEAQCHSHEARAANATIAEIYQLVTGATGEPGNWHGAEPVRAYIAEQRKVMEQALEALESCDVNDGHKGITQHYDEKLVEPAIAALRARLGGQTGSDGVNSSGKEQR